MKRLISLFFLASAPLCADFYGSIGVGPYAHTPEIGIGYREYYDEFDFDTSLSFSYSDTYNVTNLTFNTLYTCPEVEIYVGPSFGYNHVELKNWGSFNDSNLGLIIGKEIDHQFVDMSIQKQIKTKGIRIKELSVRIRYGVFF